MEITIQQSHMIWGVFSCIYGLGSIFSSSIVKRDAASLCWVSCMFGLLVFHTSGLINQYLVDETGYKLAIGHYFYTLGDAAILVLLIKVFNKILTPINLLFSISIVTHLTAIITDSLGYAPFIKFAYEPIMVFTNIIIIGVLFHDSHGHRLISKFSRICIQRAVRFWRYLFTYKNIQAKKLNHNGVI
jgi:hypothetical protein